MGRNARLDPSWLRGNFGLFCDDSAPAPTEQLTRAQRASTIVQSQAGVNMAASDPYKEISTIVKIAFVVALILGSYNLWSFFNSSRYQALCGASFWELNRSELESCLDQKKELDK